MEQVPLTPPQEDAAPYVFSPIRAAAPRPRRALASTLALGLPALVVLASAFMVAATTTRPFPPRRVTVDVSLADFEEAPAPRPVLPDPKPQYPAGPGVGPGAPGLGHVEGSGAIDPELLKIPLATRHHLGILVDPEGGFTLEPASPVALGDRNLPEARGGNGTARGAGLDAGRGGGGSAPDQRLVLIHEEPAVSNIHGLSNDLKVPVVVRVIIGEAGIPVEANVISGPIQLHDSCREAALHYRWEPLKRHGLKAPVDVTITFHPWVMEGKSKKRLGT